MTTYSIIQKSQLEGALRLDAEYYQPEYLDIKDNLVLIGSKPLKDFLKLLYRYPTFYNLQYYNQGILVLKGEDMTSDGFIQNQSQDFISVKDSKRFPKTILKEGDLIFSVRGYVGKVGIVDKKYEGSIISANLIRAELKDISPYFVWVFLNSEYGVNQINRVKMITAQETIIADDIKNFFIPTIGQLKQKEIENVAEEAIQKVRESESFYSQAENLLLGELGLKDFKVEEDLSYIVNLSEVKSAHRADAEYFQPKYEKIFDFVKSPIKKLDEITKFLNHAKQPPYVGEGEIPIITQKHLGAAFLNPEMINDPYNKFTSAAWLKKYPKYKLKVGDVLYYSVGAYIGKTNIVFDDFNATAASFITIIRSTEEVNPVYLTVVLNSIIGQLQSEKWQSATAQQYIYPKDIKNFKIPILPKSTQQKIADLVQKSHEARKKAKELLNQAKQKVEELIEK